VKVSRVRSVRVVCPKTTDPRRSQLAKRADFSHADRDTVLEAQCRQEDPGTHRSRSRAMPDWGSQRTIPFHALEPLPCMAQIGVERGRLPRVGRSSGDSTRALSACRPHPFRQSRRLSLSSEPRSPINVSRLSTVWSLRLSMIPNMGTSVKLTARVRGIS